MRKTRVAEGRDSNLCNSRDISPPSSRTCGGGKRLPGLPRARTNRRRRPTRSQWTAANLSRFDDRENDNATIRPSVCSHCPFCFRPIARLPTANISPGHGGSSLGRTVGPHSHPAAEAAVNARAEVTCADDGRTDMGGTRASEENCSSPHKTRTRAGLPGFLLKG